MSLMKLDIAKSGVVISEAMKAEAKKANELLHSGEGAGNDFLGWVNLPSSIDAAQLAAIEEQAAKLRQKADVVICIGIGGSYLGAKAVIEAMNNSFEASARESHSSICWSEHLGGLYIRAFGRSEGLFDCGNRNL